jgi:hypothetical protein
VHDVAAHQSVDFLFQIGKYIGKIKRVACHGLSSFPPLWRTAKGSSPKPFEVRPAFRQGAVLFLE